MSNAVLSASAQPDPAVVAIGTSVATVVLALWLVVVLVLGAGGAFVTPLGTPPLPILIGVTVPITVFLAGYWLSSLFRNFILAADLPFLAGIQAWRFVGFGFLALYAHGVLPGVFAWPAGLGDVAIGVTAPWIIAALLRRPRFAASKGFIAWNLLGVLDLVVAVGVGALSYVLAVPDEVTTRPMTELPLVLIPAYLVPIFVMLHAAALFQARHLTGQSGERA